MDRLPLYCSLPRALHVIQHSLGKSMVLPAIVFSCSALAQDSSVGGQSEAGSGSQQSTLQRVEMVARQGSTDLRRSASVAKQINADVKKILEDKDVLDKFSALGAEPFETTPQEFQAILNADIKTWAAVVKSSGATAD